MVNLQSITESNTNADWDKKALEFCGTRTGMKFIERLAFFGDCYAPYNWCPGEEVGRALRAAFAEKRWGDMFSIGV